MAASGGLEQDTPILSPRKSSPRRRRNNNIYIYTLWFIFTANGKNDGNEEISETRALVPHAVKHHIAYVVYTGTSYLPPVLTCVFIFVFHKKKKL